MNDVRQQFWRAREDYYNAKIAYGLLCNTEVEATAWHDMQAAWERLRVALRKLKGAGVA